MAEPITHLEQTIAGQVEPITHLEHVIAEYGGGGGGGGTSDYTQLSNKPKINNVELDGNKTSSDLGLQDTVAFEGTYNSSSNKAATMADIKDGKLTGYAQGSGNVAATDKVIEAIGKVEKKADTNQNNILKVKGISDSDINYIEMGNGIKIFISATEPTSGMNAGDIGFGW